MTDQFGTFGIAGPRRKLTGSTATILTEGFFVTSGKAATTDANLIIVVSGKVGILDITDSIGKFATTATIGPLQNTTQTIVIVVRTATIVTLVVFVKNGITATFDTTGETGKTATFDITRSIRGFDATGMDQHIPHSPHIRAIVHNRSTPIVVDNPQKRRNQIRRKIRHNRSSCYKC